MTHTKKVKKFEKLKVNDQATFAYLDETKITGRVIRRPRNGEVKLLLGRSWRITAPQWAFVKAERPVSDLKPGDRVEIIKAESPNFGRRGTVLPVPDHRPPLSVAPYIEWDEDVARGKSKNKYFISEDKLRKVDEVAERFPVGARVAYGSQLGERGVVESPTTPGGACRAPGKGFVLVRWPDNSLSWVEQGRLVLAKLRHGDRVEVRPGARSLDGVHAGITRRGKVYELKNCTEPGYTTVEFTSKAVGWFTKKFKTEDLTYIEPGDAPESKDVLLRRLTEATDILSEMKQILKERG